MIHAVRTETKVETHAAEYVLSARHRASGTVVAFGYRPFPFGGGGDHADAVQAMHRVLLARGEHPVRYQYQLLTRQESPDGEVYWWPAESWSYAESLEVMNGSRVVLTPAPADPAVRRNGSGPLPAEPAPSDGIPLAGFAETAEGTPAAKPAGREWSEVGLYRQCVLSDGIALMLRRGEMVSLRDARKMADLSPAVAGEIMDAVAEHNTAVAEAGPKNQPGSWCGVPGCQTCKAVGDLLGRNAG